MAGVYAYLDYPQAAVAELDKAIQLEPRDEMAVQVREIQLARLPDPEAPVITPGQITHQRFQ